MNSRKNILVTRPTGQAAALCEVLAEQGYSAFEQPLLELHKVQENTPSINHALDNIDNYQHLIFISGNAVRFGMEKILERWQAIPKDICVYAIGHKTAAALREHGLEVICADFDALQAAPLGGAGPMTSEDLLAVASLQQIEGQAVLIVKGQGGRNTLREGLAGRGARVDELACYERQCPRLAPGELANKFSSWKIDLLLISSGEGFGNMLALLSPAETINLYAIPLIVPSARVACMARDAGFTAVHEAENATDHAMFEAVQQLQRYAGDK